jgi:hypothetical protein
MKNLKGKRTGRRKQSFSGKGVGVNKGALEQFIDDKLDQALADTFPASDPIPWISEVRKIASDTKAKKESRKPLRIKK